MSLSLRELYLGWNRITGFGAKQIFLNLNDSSRLAVLDLSNNNIGKNYSEGTSNSICKFLEVNTKLLHLDISQNNIPGGSKFEAF